MIASSAEPVVDLHLDLKRMERNSAQAATLLKTLSNHHRLMILCCLAEGSLSVGELNARIPLTQSALSQHLAVLRREGLVSTQRDGQTIHYSLRDSNAIAVISLLHELYCD